MVLAMPVPLPGKPGHILLKPGATLDTDTIARLAELRVTTIHIEYPSTAYLMRYCSPALVCAQSTLAERVAEGLDAVTDNLHASFDFLSFLTGLRSLVQIVIDNPDCALFTDDIAAGGKPLISHSFNVGVLSLLMGLRLDGHLASSRRPAIARKSTSVENLGLGGLLLDIGLARIEPAALARWITTRDESDPAWREHVIRGYDLVKGRIPPTAAAVVLNHHQRIDGTGFPSKRSANGIHAQSGADIHVFSRIAAVADVFNRARGAFDTPGPSGTSPHVPSVIALRRTLDQVRAGRLDATAFRALVTIAPAFPPGSIVELNDKRACVVTGWDPADPCRPTVSPLPSDPRLFPDLMTAAPSSDPAAMPEMINLAHRRALRIVRADGVDVSRELFAPAFPGEFDLRARHPTAIPHPHAASTIDERSLAAHTAAALRTG